MPPSKSKTNVSMALLLAGLAHLRCDGNHKIVLCSQKIAQSPSPPEPEDRAAGALALLFCAAGLPACGALDVSALEEELIGADAVAYFAFWNCTRRLSSL